MNAGNDSRTSNPLLCCVCGYAATDRERELHERPSLDGSKPLPFRHLPVDKCWKLTWAERDRLRAALEHTANTLMYMVRHPGNIDAPTLSALADCCRKDAGAADETSEGVCPQCKQDHGDHRRACPVVRIIAAAGTQLRRKDSFRVFTLAKQFDTAYDDYAIAVGGDEHWYNHIERVPAENG